MGGITPARLWSGVPLAPIKNEIKNTNAEATKALRAVIDCVTPDNDLPSCPTRYQAINVPDYQKSGLEGD
jgi:hypothetical protein